MSKINLSRFLMAAVMTLLCTLVIADDAAQGKPENIPYKLIEGKQYEICNALLPVINTAPHGSFRDDPTLLTKAKDVKLPDWRPVKEKKYIDLYIRNFAPLFPKEFSKEKYQENIDKIAKELDADERRFYVARIDLENSGKPRSALRHEAIDKKHHIGGYYFFGFDEENMAPDDLYRGGTGGQIILFKGRTFLFAEWLIGSEISYWNFGVSETYFQENRSPKAVPSVPIRDICKFSAK